MNNTEIWDALGTTDPEHTKSFRRAGGFSGTAIKPMWAYRRMTEQFGPCGKGWGVLAPTFDIQDCGEIRLVYCTATAWYMVGNERCEVVGVGGDSVIGKNKHGPTFDDEAYKKAFTDATTNALKMIGVGADVHMGMFDDSKYVNDTKAQFQAKAKSSAALKRDDAWAEFQADLNDCKSLAALEKCKETWRTKVKADGWNQTWINAMPDVFAAHETQLMNENDAKDAA